MQGCLHMPVKFSDGQAKFSETISPLPNNFWLREINILIYFKIKIWGKGEKRFEQIFSQKQLKDNTQESVPM